MILFYDNAGQFVAKEFEQSWQYNQKKNEIGKGTIESVPFYANARYASLYKGSEKIKDVLLEKANGKGNAVKFDIKTLESLLENYKTPQNWQAWNKKPLSFIVADALYGFDYVRFSRVEDFAGYLEKKNIALNKIKDGDIHLDTFVQDDGIHYYTEGHITFCFDLGDIGGQRFIRWDEKIGEKVYISVQSAGSDTPITDIAQVDFTQVPLLDSGRGIKDSSRTMGVPIVSNKRFVAVRFVLKYVNPDYINDFASLDVYNNSGALVKRTVRGFTPVLSAFEIITRPKIALDIKLNIDGMSDIVDGLDLSNITIWEALKRIREKFPFDNTAYLENNKAVFEVAKSLEKDNTATILRADDVMARHLNNAQVGEFKQNLQKVNVLHCYGEGENLEALYVRVPEVGSYDGLTVIADTFTDNKIKNENELRIAGEKKLAELRKDKDNTLEVESAENIRLFDKITFVYPKDTKNPLLKVQVAEEKISYKENVLKKEFGLDGWRFNPLQTLVSKRADATIRTYANKPYNVQVIGNANGITLQWGGEEASYIIKWKKLSDSEYNYRNVQGLKSEFDNLVNLEKYVFSVAGVFGNAVSEYTDEISVEVVDRTSGENNGVIQVAQGIPKYLGMVEKESKNQTVIIVKGKPTGAVDAKIGDWVLCWKNDGIFHVGKCYKWTGNIWQILEPEVNYPSEYQACLIDLLSIDELRQDTGYFGALFAKLLVAQKALIDDLTASQAFIKKLVVQKLHIDTDPNTQKDFEAWFDEANGLKINNGGEEIFKVDSGGNIYIKGASVTANKLIAPTLPDDPIDAVFGEIWFRSDV